MGNFGLEQLSAKKQYRNMASELVELLGLVDIVYGGSHGELENWAAELSKSKHGPLTPPLGDIKSNLEAIIKELGLCNDKDVKAPGP
jgi:hypothetical protein